ncbi:hypothetical protein [Geminisphaera colitermitum]|uniref:hypothetical protein n=1 Tax=Geminisphaera colitermitum TaxID=1148786 RepID=UPI000158D4B5|nr:hypothetical protein [Geminisphaera colitermitum]
MNTALITNPPRILRHAFRHKGGGTPAMPAPAAPPPAATATEVQLQRRDTLKDAARKKGIQSTILAGAGDSAPGSGKGSATVLGGA